MTTDTAEQAEAPKSVWVPGGWVPRRPTLPLDADLKAVVDFAERSWSHNLDLQMHAAEADHKLAIAEEALRRLSNRSLNKDVAIALAAVQGARSQL